MGLKADPDEKTPLATLPVLIRSLHHHFLPHLTDPYTGSGPYCIFNTPGSTAIPPRLLSLLCSSPLCSFCSYAVCVLHSHAFNGVYAVSACTSVCAYLVPCSPPALSKDRNRDLGTSFPYIW